MLYKIIRLISFAIRAYLCYLTIDNIPIFENYLLNSMFLEVCSLYTILMIASRLVVSIFYSKGEAPVLGSIMYFGVYLFNLELLYLVMLGSTKVGVLPIVL